MAWSYDDDNVFARILRGEIPNDTVLETEHALAFRDLSPQAPEHVLVIPKGPYVDAAHFGAEAPDAELAGFARAVAEVARALGVSTDGGGGFRTIANAGGHAHQEVPHYHVHVLGGRPLGPLLAG
ncbi:histidine triad (HIT) family protein [Hasllibacter halocynthiae]|uniref:Histidine triad (HIT) family protein n=1 Tax=Hasllibacter halocynthiae TaxID=595589 RepID=A0A2T0X1A9_9RHOB|nr:HIT domain-containing protein [Hasllibacter halocynthiae]PRY92739.1 histidine triad (HIT) family protein [Hasllibacter halocynthiae]